MKKISLVIFSLSIILGSVSAKDVFSEIKEVTVFERGAQVERKVKVQLTTGISTVVIKNLSRFIDANSIQAKAPGAKIINLTYSLDYLTEEEGNSEKKQLEDSLTVLNYQLKLLKNRKEINEQELKLIQKNVDIKGQAVLDVADLEDFLFFYRRNLPLIKNSLLSIEIKQKEIEEIIKKLKNELRSLKSSSQKAIGKVTIELSSTAKNTVPLMLNYYVKNAGWTPYYNLRATALDAPIEMEFNAQVFQNTGVEWKGVQLTLATGTPHLEGNAPALSTWYVHYQQSRSRGDKKFKQRVLMEGNLAISNGGNQNIGVSGDYSSSAVAIDNITFREYRISEPYNISSNGKRKRVEIKKYNLAANYAYYSAPKVSTSAYLIAKVDNWEQYNILSGQSKIYFEDTYVGQGYIDAYNTEDTLEISLGQDKNIIIDREIKLDKSGKQFIGLKQSKTKAFDIVVRNNKKVVIKIEIVDQIPVSKDDAIKVKLIESSEAKLDPSGGQLKWLFEVGPFGKEVKSFEFEVTYPKNKKITL